MIRLKHTVLSDSRPTSLERLDEFGPARIELISRPTPVVPLPRFTTFLGREAARNHTDGPASVLMKRDDVMTLGMGGNKLRNLEYVCAEAIQSNATALVSAGGRHANHCRLVAAAAAHLGIRAHILLFSTQTSTLWANEALIRMYGANVTYSDAIDPAGRSERVANLMDSLVSRGERPYFTDGPIRGVIGAYGPLRGAMEAAGQLDEVGIHPTSVFVGVATGGTIAGLSSGFGLVGYRPQVIGVPTHLAGASSPEEVHANIQSLRKALIESVTQALHAESFEAAPVSIDDRQHWSSPESVDDPAEEAQRLLGQTEGIVTDPIYTSRAVASILDWTRRGHLRDAVVMLWNGGGVPAVFDHAAPARLDLASPE